MVFSKYIFGYKEDFSKDDVRIYHPLQIWTWIKGNDAWTRSKPVEPLHRDPRIWEQLSDEQKETFDILDTRALGMPSHALMAASMHFAKRCDFENNLYVLAKSEFQDPRSSLRAGKALSDCAEGTFNFILEKCPTSFKDYARCIENNEWTIYRCRKEQYHFDMCMHENGQEKSKLGFRETVIQDQDVPWKKPLNPLNFKMPAGVVPEKHYFDPLRSMSAAPTNDAFKDFIVRSNEAKSRRLGAE